MLFIQQVRIIGHIGMMLKLLVGLSLTTAICGNVINPQNNVDPQQPTNFENSEVLLKVWTILSDLLGPDGKSVKVPDAAQLKYALTLIKKFIEENPSLNHETSKKLQQLENELAQKNDIILNDKRPLRTLLDADPIKNDLSSNMLFRYDLPSSIKPSCKAAFLNLIDLAQEAYVNMARSPVCTDANAEPLVLNKGDFAYNVPSGRLHQNHYNSAMLSPSEEALKRVAEYLKAPANYNLNNVLMLLQSLHPKVPYATPLNYELYPYYQPQIKNNAINYNQNYAPNNLPDINKNYIDAKNHYSPLQGDFNINLEHAKDIANKLNAQNLYKNMNPVATERNPTESNGHPTPADVSNGGSVLNYSPNKQLSQAELQKLYYIPIEKGNNQNVQNFIKPQQNQNNLYQPPPTGYTYLNPYQNQGNIEINEKLKDLEYLNNGGDNFNNNKFYPGGLNNPSNINHNAYQNTLPNEKNPVNFPWAFQPNNNLALDKQPHDANGVANGAKLEKTIRPKGQVELTYLLKRKRPLIYQPFYFVKYRLPYNYFVENLRQMLSLEPDLSTPPTELYKGLIAPSNATEVSPDLASYPKEEIHNLVLKDGALVKATYIEPNVTDSNDTTRDPERDSSEVVFEGDVKQNDEKSKISGGLNSHQNEHNYPVSNGAELNLPVHNKAVRNQAALYNDLYPFRQENQSPGKVLAAFGLEKIVVKKPNLTVPSQVNLPNTEENQASYHPEIPLHNIDNQQQQQHPSLDQIYSPYKEIQQAASNPLNPPYITDNQFGQRNPYVIGSQAALSQKPPSYTQAYQYQQETPLAKLGDQFFRPPYLDMPPYRVASQVGPNESPYVIGTQSALGLHNKFLGNNLSGNNLYAFRQSRRLLGGYWNPNQYGYDRPGLYPNGPGSPYLSILGNQGILGQPGLGNQLGNGLGLGQSSLYGQPPYLG